MKDYSCSTLKSDTSKIFSFSLHFFWSTRLQLRQERKLSQRQILFQLKSSRDRRINPLPCSVQAVHPTAAGGNAARWGIPPADLQGQGLPHGCVSSHACGMHVTSDALLWSSMGCSVPWHKPHSCPKCPPMCSSGAWKSYARAQILWASPWALLKAASGRGKGASTVVSLGVGAFGARASARRLWGKGLWAFPSSPLQQPGLEHHFLSDLTDCGG